VGGAEVLTVAREGPRNGAAAEIEGWKALAAEQRALAEMLSAEAEKVRILGDMLEGMEAATRKQGVARGWIQRLRAVVDEIAGAVSEVEAVLRERLGLTPRNRSN